MIGRPRRVRTVILALVTLMIALGLFIFPVGDYGRGVRGIARCINLEGGVVGCIAWGNFSRTDPAPAATPPDDPRFQRFAPADSTHNPRTDSATSGDGDTR